MSRVEHGALHQTSQSAKANDPIYISGKELKNSLRTHSQPVMDPPLDESSSSSGFFPRFHTASLSSCQYDNLFKEVIYGVTIYTKIISHILYLKVFLIDNFLARENFSHQWSHLCNMWMFLLFYLLNFINWNQIKPSSFYPFLFYYEPAGMLFMFTNL